MSRSGVLHVATVKHAKYTNTYVYHRKSMTMIDRFTWWPEAVPRSDIEATTVVKAFITTWVSRFDVPSVIASDRGRQFDCQLVFRAFFQKKK